MRDICLPLSRLLNLYVGATDGLRGALNTFLGEQGSQSGMTGVWEVPNESVARQARKLLASQNIINIRVRIASP